MKITFRPMKPEEHKYAYAQSHQLTTQCGNVGNLFGDFGESGKDFSSVWVGQNLTLITNDFKLEMNTVMNAIRFEKDYGGLLQSYNKMLSCCLSQPDSKMNDIYTGHHGFRADTDKYAYLIHCNPQTRVGNFFVRPYVSEWLDRNIEKAAQGIRFIDSGYQELFRIPDGERIQLTYSDGEQIKLPCRFIDECHTEVGNNLYHICQFAEAMERNGTTYVPATTSETHEKSTKHSKSKDTEHEM